MRTSDALRRSCLFLLCASLAASCARRPEPAEERTAARADTTESARAAVDTVPPPGEPDKVPPAPAGKRWLRCDTPDARRYVKTIGSAGGRLPHPRGHVLVVPPGAVPDGTEFFMQELEAGELMVLVGVLGRPQGVEFKPPATLTLSWAECGVTDLPPGQAPARSLYRVRRGAGGRDTVTEVGGRVRDSTITVDTLRSLSGYLIADG